LYLFNNSISNIQDINFPPRLVEINLSGNAIVNLENQKWPSSLQKLYLYRNQITNIEKVVWPEKLLILSLLGNHLINVDFVNWPKYLKVLNLSHNKIKKITFPSWPNNLDYLLLEDNNLCVYENVPICNCKIRLNYNLITKIKQHIPITNTITGVTILKYYKKSEISDFTQDYDFYFLLETYKIQCAYNSIICYLRL
jgi:hypothetical protein